MQKLNGTLGSYTPTALLADNHETQSEAVSLAPKNGLIPAGAVLYCNSQNFFAPAGSAHITEDDYLVVLKEATDTDGSETVAAAAAVYRHANFIRGKVLAADGNGGYTPVSREQSLVLRKQGITMSPMDDWSKPQEVADNTATVSVTVTNDGHGTGAASPASGSKGSAVTLSATPASGYTLDYWEVVSGDVTVTDGAFVIGDSAVTVKAHFKSE